MSPVTNGGNLIPGDPLTLNRRIQSSSKLLKLYGLIFTQCVQHFNARPLGFPQCHGEVTTQCPGNIRAAVMVLLYRGKASMAIRTNGKGGITVPPQVAGGPPARFLAGFITIRGSAASLS